MKKPRRRLTKEEYSSFVVLGCVIIGTFLMILVTLSVSNLGFFGKAVMLAFLCIILICFSLILVYEIKAYLKGGDDKK